MSPLEEMLVKLKAMGFDLILVWMLSIAIIYGILTKIKMPESYSARGVISIAAGFLIMLASAGSGIPVIIQNIVVSLIVIGFVLLLVIIFLELMGIKSTEIMQKYSPLVLISIAVIAFLVFLSSGATNLFNVRIAFSQGTLALIIFLILMSFVIWVLAQEGKGGEK